MTVTAGVQRQTILVVDDEPAILRALTSALTARGYLVREALTGQSAIDMVAVDPPDAIVLDLRLPDIDGVEVCRRVRTWSRVPIIVLSADGLDQRKVDALDEGANDYVTKPYSTPELLARLRAVLRSALVARPRRRRFARCRRYPNRPRPPVCHGRRPSVDLTPKEFAFLALVGQIPRVGADPSRDPARSLGPQLRNRDPIPTVYAGQIRKKLDDDMRNPRLVTDLGVGYRLQPRAEPTPSLE